MPLDDETSEYIKVRKADLSALINALDADRREARESLRSIDKRLGKLEVAVAEQRGRQAWHQLTGWLVRWSPWQVIIIVGLLVGGQVGMMVVGRALDHIGLSDVVVVEEAPE